MRNFPVVKDLVLVGGGHSHVIVLRMLGMKPMPGLQVTLVSPDVRTAYSGMLPGVVAGHYGADDIHIDLDPLCRFAGARFVKAKVDAIDTVNRTVKCDGRPDLPYDVLSLDIGITPSLEDVPGAAETAIAVKPINRFLAKWDRFLERVAAGEVRSAGFVGAGAGGVELCLAVQHRLQAMGRGDIGIHLFADSATVLPDFPERVRERFATHLRQRGIAFHAGYRVLEVAGKTLLSADGQQCDVDEVFFVTRAASQDWLRDTGLALDDNGFVKVRATLQSVNHDDVFAVGDIAHVVDFPRPKAGVFAVRQGPPLYRNLRRALLGRTPRRFKPQQEFLSLVTTGGRRAVASKYGMSAEGAWVWRWKDWVDRRFMYRFTRLPKMKAEKFTGLLADFDDQMRCGGCGAKVSADLLREVLAELGVGVQGLDDAAIYTVPEGKSMLHTVDAFRAFIDDPWVFARVAVNHALGDIYAMGGEPVSALAVMTLPYATPAKTRALLQQLLAGALDKLRAEGVELVGGHTSEGPELSLGFAVNGIVDKDSVLGKAGMQDGDALVLTKALGTGALFAADMQAKARGEWIESAVESMLQSNREALAIFKANGAHALTDVTGFGLAGHLNEMLAASTMAATLDLDALPVLPGTLEVMAAGFTSTLHPGNRRSVNGIDASGHPRFEVIFDPQTSGGLLGAVPAANAEAVVRALASAGYAAAAVIGDVQAAEVPAIRFT